MQALAIGQLAMSIIIVLVAKKLGIIHVRSMSLETAWKIKEIILLNFGNLLFGLGGTKALR